MPGILLFKNSSGKSYNEIEDILTIGDIRMLPVSIKNTPT